MTDLDLAPAVRLNDVVTTTGLHDLPAQCVRSLLAACDAVLDAYDGREEPLSVVYRAHARAVIAFLVEDGRPELAELALTTQAARIAVTTQARRIV